MADSDVESITDTLSQCSVNGASSEIEISKIPLSANEKKSIKLESVQYYQPFESTKITVVTNPDGESVGAQVSVSDFFDKGSYRYEDFFRRIFMLAPCQDKVRTSAEELCLRAYTQCTKL